MAKAMDITGGAKAIAKAIIKIMGTEWAFISVPLACGVLCYGGVSAFVCSFCVFPIALQVFRAADPAAASPARCASAAPPSP